MSVIAIIDYGAGNLRSVEKALARVGYRGLVTGRPEEILAADEVILPGVGAFMSCMAGLRERGLVPVISDVIRSGRPFLGICLGLQLLFSESEEGAQPLSGGPDEGFPKGLDILPGRVARFPAGRKVPQIGWNQVALRKPDPLFDGIPDRSFFYFVHSYYAVPEDPGVLSGASDYGVEFAAAIHRDNLFAVQFHPEKSGEPGLLLLENFARLAHGPRDGRGGAPARDGQGAVHEPRDGQGALKAGGR